MKPKLMVSYSRQQIPFVDELYKSLVKAGYDVWLDYQRLVPSEAWFDQITAGVKNADIVLLVVSKDSMASKNVKDEWELALKDGKRVILVLFEATPIENEQLKKCEYVDFRTNYKAGLKQLDALLNSEPQPEEKRTLVPESGFNASFTFWVVLVTSLLLAVGSISVAWTVFLPFILMPLPMRIYQRNYNFSQVAPTLFMMPIFFVFSASILRSEGNIFYLLPQFVFTFGAIAAILSWVLLVLLLTPAIRLRARPEAVPARAVNRTKIVEEVKHKSVKFFIDHAPEDGKYAKVLRHVLEKHEHEFVEGDKNPEAVFVLLSTYKNKTIYKAGNGLSLFPIVLQKPGNVDGELGKIQWLDFRRGLKNLEKIAKLLPEPAKLVRAMAVPPTGRQDVFCFSDQRKVFEKFFPDGRMAPHFLIQTLANEQILPVSENHFTPGLIHFVDREPKSHKTHGGGLNKFFDERFGNAAGQESQEIIVAGGGVSQRGGNAESLVPRVGIRKKIPGSGCGRQRRVNGEVLSGPTVRGGGDCHHPDLPSE